MLDISLAWDAEAGAFDLATSVAGSGADLLGDDGLLTSIIISLFTDRRANADDPLPDERVGQPSDLRGWWGDHLVQDGDVERIGSRLWLLHREKEMPEVVARADEYAREALEWLTRGGYVAEVRVRAEHAGRGYLGILVQTVPPPGNLDAPQEWNFTYDYINARPVTLTVPGGM